MKLPTLNTKKLKTVFKIAEILKLNSKEKELPQIRKMNSGSSKIYILEQKIQNFRCFFINTINFLRLQKPVNLFR